MAIYRLSDDFYEHAYTLIALHCPLEDYRLAYFLNVQLRTGFKKLPGIDFYQNNNTFSLYEWEDLKNGNVWNLISNVSRSGSTGTTDNTLFSENMAVKTSYLIPERKQTDYFLKIDGEIPPETLESTIQKIHKIPQVITTYNVDPDQLKSKHNLIL